MTFQVRGLAALSTAFLLLLGGVRVAWAQSLADVAKQEEERRKGITQPGKVYTNKDLHNLPPVIGGTVPDAATPASDGSATAQSGSVKNDKPESAAEKGPDKNDKNDKADKSDKTDRKADKGQVRDQAYWAGRLKDLKAQLDRDQTFADALQSRINVLSADFVNHDDPAQRAMIAQSKQKALDELGRLKKAILDDKKALTDLDDEARRAGVPPGWLRF